MLIRHPDQDVHTPGFEVIEPPPGFVEEAYELGVERGSGVVKFEQHHRLILGSFKAKLNGVWIFLRSTGETNNEAARRLLNELRRVAK